MTMHRLTLAVVASLLPAGATASMARAQVPVPCERLAAQRLRNVTITAAVAITDGRFTPPGSPVAGTGLPPFCRVTGVIAPTADSHIVFELWLPLDHWNHKFSTVGNGGWAGSIGYNLLAGQLKRGYATASTNTGHDAPAAGEDAAKFAFGHPERLVDFASRAYHETTVDAKVLTTAFYGAAPEHAYWIGCSTGGCEGLMEAQRYPDDFDGIVAGAPANNFTRLMAGDLDGTLALLQDPASALSPAAKGLIARAAIAACDKIDGVADGVLEDPPACPFDPGVLQCAAGLSDVQCLTPAQVEADRRVHRGLVDPASGRQIFPGLATSSEPGWVNGSPATALLIPISYYKWLVFRDSAWDWRTFSFGHPADAQASANADAMFAPILNATNPDLRDFQRRGGKLIQYHGWIDQLISPQNSIDYYESVIAFDAGGGKDRAAALRDVQSFYRLFMIPGMGHCSGGPGPNFFDMQTALEQWVEHGVAPDVVIGSHLIGAGVSRTRPLCPYPSIARYGGRGSTDSAANFSCGPPPAARGG